ncbi:ABC transporter ATP-binding protein [Alteromonas lipolytica]|uniref:ABC transporter ATP-binding protein n=1 Tax=Alteromonas lipolytica TaxID=1856405 RepID=UPI00111314DB|nr:ABC transporter ATP-binding protein [Alteromonas lipolytica]GGF72328.1 ABC transporter [Alteromonas lipolytica]
MTTRLALKNITKAYPGCVANDDISFSLNRGEIHALLGENGAGKSTLMNIIYGVVQPDAGELFINDVKVTINSPADARSYGIGMVFQHFTLFDSMTVAENIALALAQKPAEVSSAIEALRTTYELYVEPEKLVGTLSMGEKQRVEIIRCLLQDIQILILDEPTSVLTPQEAEQLFALLNTLSAKGCAVIFISHKLSEVARICHSATILRRGKVSGKITPGQTSLSTLTKLMMGDQSSVTKTECRAASQSFLTVEGLSTRAYPGDDTALKNLCFDVKQGEILGIAGVAGNGQEALLSALSGEINQYQRPAGDIRFNGQSVIAASPVERRSSGMGYVPAERLGRGAVANMSLVSNALLTCYGQGLLRYGFINIQAVQQLTRSIIAKFGVRTPGIEANANQLSGGNLQKFILGRELQQQPRLLIAAHPTWGVDISAQQHIYRDLLTLRDSGCAILIISEDTDELFTLCDRIGALCHGELSPLMAANQVSLDQLGQWMLGEFAHAS